MNRGRLLPALLLLACLSIRARAAGADGAEWKSDAHCTFYTGTTDVSGGYAGNCGYGDLSRPLGDAPPYGPLFFAGSPLLYGGGAGCGSCYEVRCANHDACNGRSVVVTMTDFCPTEGNLPWCAPDRIHFDLSGYAMAQIVKDVAVGTTPLEYRRVDCPREGPAVVGVVGNPYWMEISVRNLARSGAYDAMRVRDAGGAWKDIKRDWGANFVVNEQLRGNISVEISDPATGDRVTLTDCIPEGWTTGAAYACRDNYGSTPPDPAPVSSPAREKAVVPAAAPPDAPLVKPESQEEPMVAAGPYAYDCTCELKPASR